MAKKKRGRKMAKWRKYAKMIVGGAGVALGGVVVFSPAISGMKKMAAGDLEGGVNEIAFNYSGFDPGNPREIVIQKPITALITVAVGLGIISLFRMIARRI